MELYGHYFIGTWQPCELPNGVTPISTKLVYTRKSNPDGSILHKCRLVARGFTQIEGESFDWDSTYAPVMKSESLRWIFSLIAEHGLEVTSSDFTQAFLQSYLTDEEDGHLVDIIIELPEGCWYTCPTTGRVLKHGRLVKAMYGLKQASHRWN